MKRQEHVCRLVTTLIVFILSAISAIVTANSLSSLENVDLLGVSVDQLKEYEEILLSRLSKVRVALKVNKTPSSAETIGEGSGEISEDVNEISNEQLIPVNDAPIANLTSEKTNDSSNSSEELSVLESEKIVLVKDEISNATLSPSNSSESLSTTTATTKHLIRSPLSASLPNRSSAYFLDRVGSLRMSPKETEERPMKELTPINAVANGVRTSILRDSENNFSKYGGGHFNPTMNHTIEECRHLSQAELVQELKQRGTYNPDLMAWDVMGVIRFLDRTITDQYEFQRVWKNRTSVEEVVERNVEALARIVHELNATCDVRSPDIKMKMANLTLVEPRHSVISPSLRKTNRMKREIQVEKFVSSLLSGSQKDDLPVEGTKEEPIRRHQALVGESHIIPFGCDKRGSQEAGYLRLCGACQAIRRLPEDFFPPFINEVTCDSDKACLYFYDYPHGKCRQKHMNFVVLRNIGTQKCQVWKKFNLNVRVSCECFVDEMSFFAKYV